MTEHLTQAEFSKGVSLVTAVTASLHVLGSLCCLLLLAAGWRKMEAEEEAEEEDEEQGAGSQNAWLWVWMTAGAALWSASVTIDKLTLASGLEQK